MKTNNMTPEKEKRIFLSEEERKDFCSADNGNPWPPCVNPNHTCADCKKTYESTKRIIEAFERQESETRFTITSTL